MTLRLGPYELCYKVVRLRGAQTPIYEPPRNEVVIWFFKDTRHRPTSTYHVCENPRNGTISDEQVAAAFVALAGLTPANAARIVATNKAAAEGLTSKQYADVYTALLRSLLTGQE